MALRIEAIIHAKHRNTNYKLHSVCNLCNKDPFLQKKQNKNAFQQQQQKSWKKMSNFRCILRLAFFFSITTLQMLYQTLLRINISPATNSLALKDYKDHTPNPFRFGGKLTKAFYLVRCSKSFGRKCNLCLFNVQTKHIDRQKKIGMDKEKNMKIQV